MAAFALRMARNFMSDIKKNDIVTLSITEINNLGCGVSRIEGGERDGTVVFVLGAVTGDVVRAKIIKVNTSFLVARVEEIVSPSPHRTSDSFCTAALSCGGCVYRCVSYEYEKEVKREYVRTAFRKAGIDDISIEPVISTGKEKHYRNKAQYPLKAGKNGIEAGFYAAKTHNLIKSDCCMIQNEIFTDIVRFFCRCADELGFSVYDENSGKGVLRHLYLRIAEATGEIMVCIVINADGSNKAKALADRIIERFPSVVSVMLNVNKKNTNVVLGDRFILCRGRDYIEDILCGKRFRITPQSFYQVNRDGAELLYGKAAELAGLTGKETLIDLYCGTGTIGLSMSDKAANLIGVEIVPSAVECARVNASLNGVENAEFYCGDASKTEDILNNRNLSADVVVIDPPRKGTTKELIEYLDRLKVPKVVYVSCDPDTLARDVAIFREYGYNTDKVFPVDMFPRTGHVENVVCLTRN